MQLTQFLGASPEEWACQSWANASTKGRRGGRRNKLNQRKATPWHRDPSYQEEAILLLQSAQEDVASAVYEHHPAVLDAKLALGDKLREGTVDSWLLLLANHGGIAARSACEACMSDGELTVQCSSFTLAQALEGAVMEEEAVQRVVRALPGVLGLQAVRLVVDAMVAAEVAVAEQLITAAQRGKRAMHLVISAESTKKHRTVCN
jgi:hypothetical protein